MRRLPQLLLAGAVLSLGVGLTGVVGGIGFPLAAICLGLSLIARMMAGETARFDEEQQERRARYEREKTNPRSD